MNGLLTKKEITMGEPSIHAGRLTLEAGKPWLGLQPVPQRLVKGRVQLAAVQTGDEESFIDFIIDYAPRGDPEHTIQLSPTQNPGERATLRWQNNIADEAYLRLLVGYSSDYDKLPSSHVEVSHVYHVTAATSDQHGIDPEHTLPAWLGATLIIETSASEGTLFYKPHSAGHASHVQAAGAVQPTTGEGAAGMVPAAPAAAAWQDLKLSLADGAVTINGGQGLPFGMYVIGKPAGQATTEPQWSEDETTSQPQELQA
jgi:hypothetical protein